MNTDRDRLLRLAEQEDGCPILVGGLMNAQPIRVLFLDVDGVLNSIRVLHEMGRNDAIDRTMVERINRVVAATGCKIVISSTWRILHPFAELTHLLRARGLVADVIGKTPNLDRPEKCRGDEIQAWLAKNPEVTKFAIVDDDADMDGVMDHLVQTSFQTGILDHHADQLITLLNS